jgi:hypothetical protein
LTFLDQHLGDLTGHFRRNRRLPAGGDVAAGIQYGRAARHRVQRLSSRGTHAGRAVTDQCIAETGRHYQQQDDTDDEGSARSRPAAARAIVES